MSIWDDIEKTFRNGSSLTRLIYINIAVFLLISVGSIIGYLLNNQTLSLKYPESVFSSIIIQSLPFKAMDTYYIYVHPQGYPPYPV